MARGLRRRRSSPAGSPTSTPTAPRRTSPSTPPAAGARMVAQWDEIKAAVSEALADHGGTITHHHAVGRDHRPWYDAQRPDPFAAALAAAKPPSTRPGSSTRASCRPDRRGTLEA